MFKILILTLVRWEPDYNLQTFTHQSDLFSLRVFCLFFPNNMKAAYVMFMFTKIEDVFQKKL